MASPLALREIPAWRGFTVETSSPGECILSRGLSLYRAADERSRPQLLAKLPISLWQGVAAGAPWLQRLLRLHVYNVTPVGPGQFFVFFDHRVVKIEGRKIIPVDGLRQKFKILRGAAAVDHKGDLYFGEYISNAARAGDVAIYRISKGTTRAEIALRFEASEVRHIHGVFADITENCLLCTTGDLGKESRILRTRDGFTTFEAIGSGDETWRSVHLVQSGASIYYGMDAEFIQNQIFSMNRAGERKSLGDVNGPVYYGCLAGDTPVFATTAELCPSQADRTARIYAVAEGSIKEIARFEKDGLPKRFFGFGTISFPNCAPAAPVYVSGRGLKGIGDRVFRLQNAAGEA